MLDAIRSLVFSLYISSTDSSDEETNILTSKGMTLATASTVASHMRLSIMVEKPHPTMPAITVGEQGGPLLPFVLRVVETLKEVGTVLRKGGYANMGMFLAEGIESSKGDPEEMVSRMVRAFPTVFARTDSINRVGTQGKHTYPSSRLLESGG